MIEGEWHAFYSKEAINMQTRKRQFNKEDNTTLTNFYRLKGTNKLVEVTCVFSVEDYPNPESYPYNWEDRKYLGIVDAWVKVGKVLY